MLTCCDPFLRGIPSGLDLRLGGGKWEGSERRRKRTGRMEGALAFSPQSPRCRLSSGSRRPPPARLPSRTLQPLRSSNLGFQHSRGFQQGSRMRCRSTGGSNGPGPGSSGENESKVVLDAFFLGKAFAEALNERIGSAVGEALSIIGQWQAEQQKQVVDFQEEVIRRAKMAKEKAALEALGGQGALSKPVRTSLDPTVPAATPPSSGPARDDPLEEMLKG